MKNLHLIATEGLDRNSGQFFKDSLDGGKLTVNVYNKIVEFKDCEYFHLHITEKERVSEGDWCVDSRGLFRSATDENPGILNKIVLTTDPTLGIQLIDNDFIIWFVSNPLSEYVEIIKEDVPCCGRCNGIDDICYADVENRPTRYKIINLEKNIEYYKLNAEEEYSETPISVLRYIGELEKEAQKNIERKKIQSQIDALNEAYEKPIRVKNMIMNLEEKLKKI